MINKSVSIRSIRENPCAMANSRQEKRRRIYEIEYVAAGRWNRRAEPGWSIEDPARGAHAGRPVRGLLG